MGRRGAIFYVLLVSLVVRVALYFLQAHPVWWDTAVYSLMGKYIFSLGREGLWEPIRPLVFPLLLGLASGFGSKVVLAWGLLLELFFTLGSVYLTYLVGRDLFSERVGLLASLLLSFTPFFFYFSYVPLSCIPSVFFALLALHFFIRKMDVAAGVFAGVAVMTRFPQGLVLLPMLALCFSARRFIRLAGSFFLVLLPYLLLNFLLYRDPLLPFVWGSGVIADAGLWMFQGSWYYYIINVLRDNVLLSFAFVGLIMPKRRNYFYVVLPLLLMFFYFSALSHKELRFAIAFLPCLSIVAAYGFCSVFKDRRSFYLMVAAVLVLFALNVRLEPLGSWDESMDFYGFLEGQDVKGEVLVSNPVVGLYTDARLGLLYYPVFDSGRARFWIDYLSNKRVDYIFLDTCNGLVCSPDDSECVAAVHELESAVRLMYGEVFSREKEGCFYRIFKNQAL